MTYIGQCESNFGKDQRRELPYLVSVGNVEEDASLEELISSGTQTPAISSMAFRTLSVCSR